MKTLHHLIIDSVKIQPGSFTSVSQLNNPAAIHYFLPISVGGEMEENNSPRMHCSAAFQKKQQKERKEKERKSQE